MMIKPHKTLGAILVKGFFILFPFLIAYLMIGQLFDMLMALTQPVLDFLPRDIAPGDWEHRFVAAGILITIFFSVGLAAYTAPARRLGHWFESTFLERFPPYSILKNLSTWIAGKEVPEQLQPALLSVTPEINMLVAIVEKLPNGDLTVFVPLAPTPGIGFLQIVSPSKVQKLDSSMSDALGWFLNWGAGTEALFKKRNG
jgi:uncharacterized membrane protein